MSELIPRADAPASWAPSMVALAADAPRLEVLFTFMAEAESHVQSLRMRAIERIATARGEETATLELTLRHPGRARIVRRASDDPLSREYTVWAADGNTVTTYDASDERASVRAARPRVVGATRADLPAFARVYEPRTALPPESVLDTFIHPAGFIRNVLLSGPVAVVGTALLAGGRESFILRADHPRATELLTDRPERWLEVGVDRQTGFLLLLVEHMGEQVTRHAEVIDMALDPVIVDEAFKVHLPSDVRMIY